MERVPAFVSVVFMLTTFVTVGIFIHMVRRSGTDTWAARLALFAVPFWLVFQFVVGSAGFYTNTAALPPRMFVFGVAPALLFIAGIFIFARSTFVASLPLTILTIIHIVRIPVELTLAWLADAHAVPQVMTFRGTNFDIWSGLTAPIALYFAYTKARMSWGVLLIWNISALLLVLNIVITAILCVPSPIQQLAFDQPNIAVLYSPYIWLPTVIVPIVFFSHFASLYQLFTRKQR